MAHCRLTWDSYNKNICNGFSQLQQSQEFVDMTLAADGHLVKVHKNLMALASPYIREMLKSASCQHPVVFLNSMSHAVLCYIVQYVYCGEVQVPTESMNAFIEAAQALHIIGLNNVRPPKVAQYFSRNKHHWKDKVTSKTSKELNKRIMLEQRSTINEDHIVKNEAETSHDENPNINNNDFQNDQTNMESFINNNPPIQYDIESIHSDSESHCINNNFVMPNTLSSTLIPRNVVSGAQTENALVTDQMPMLQEDVQLPKPWSNEAYLRQSQNDYTIPVLHGNAPGMEINPQGTFEQPKGYNVNIELPSLDKNSGPVTVPLITIKAGIIEKLAVEDKPIEIDPKAPMYTTTNRGSLQMILNRYMYNIHHVTDKSNRKRWRCIDYRHQRCKAFIDTHKEVIIKRKFPHNHPFHDEKILKAGRTKQIFKTIAEAAIVNKCAAFDESHSD